MIKLFRAINVFSILIAITFSFIFSAADANAQGAQAIENAAGITSPSVPTPPVDKPNILCTDSALSISGIGCRMWQFLSEIILGIVAALAAISASLFDVAMQKFVLQISFLFLNSGGSDREYVYKAWAVMRDLGNIIAFFGAVYTGFRYIIGREDLNFQKAVVKLIMYSLIVNFSFPISKFLIDISNVVSLQVYGSFIEYKGAGSGALKDQIMNAVGVNRFVSNVGKIQADSQGFSSFTVLWLAIIFLFCAFFVFLYTSLQILIRGFILLACVIFSPLMFLNFAFPKITELHEKWRDNFFGQLVFAPLLMIGFWLAVTLLKASTAITGADLGSSSAIGTADQLAQSDMVNTINAIMAIVALLLGVFLAGKASGGVGKFISNGVGGMMKNVGLAAVTGGASTVVRGTVGKAGAWMANRDWVKKTVQGEGSQNGRVRKMAASIMTKTGNRLENAKLFKNSASYSETKGKKLETAKAEFMGGNEEKLKKYGLLDDIKSAKTPEQVKKLEEELENRMSNPKDESKWNKDVLGITAAKIAMKAEQEKLRRVNEAYVTGGKRREFKAEVELLDNLKSKSYGKAELDEYDKAKAEDVKLKAEILSSDDYIKLLKSKANPDETEIKLLENAKKHLEDLKEKEVKVKAIINKKEDLDKKISDSEAKIDKLKNTSLTYKVGTAVGDNVGAAKSAAYGVRNAVLDKTGVTKGIMIAEDIAQEVKERVIDLADRPSIVSNIKSSTLDAIRGQSGKYKTKREGQLETIRSGGKADANQDATAQAASAQGANTSSPSQAQTQTTAPINPPTPIRGVNIKT